jgi:hypothetical protein
MRLWLIARVVSPGTYFAVGLVQNTVSSPFWDGATRIAQHYKFLLSHAFDSNPAAPYVRVLPVPLLLLSPCVILRLLLSP